MTRQYTTRELADILDTDEWRVRRLYELGVLPEPPRFANKRIICPSAIPTIVDALRQRGWLTTETNEQSEVGHVTRQRQSRTLKAAETQADDELLRASRNGREGR
jgi:hypothetical protein